MDADPRPELRAELLQPSVPSELQEASSMCSAIAARDILLHHPYESYDPVVRFIDEAADDPNVLALKMTLYRTSGGDSPFVRALSRFILLGAALTVTIVIARFNVVSVLLGFSIIVVGIMGEAAYTLVRGAPE